MDFSAQWLNCLLEELEESGKSKECLFDRCAGLHYRVNGMDAILEKYVGDLPGFIAFLEKEWGWIVTRREDGSLLVDENKDFCVCPIAAQVESKVSPALCGCSERFAMKMFTKVCQKNVKAKVRRSFLRDGKSCIYEITL